MSRRERNSGRVTLAPDDPKRQRAPRRVCGEPPSIKYAPYKLLTFDRSWRRPGDALTLEWDLWVLCRHCEHGWVNTKLTARATVRHKANYWLGWHVEGERFGRRADYAALKMLRPELLQRLEVELADICKPGGLTSRDFLRGRTLRDGKDPCALYPYRVISTEPTASEAGCAMRYSLSPVGNSAEPTQRAVRNLQVGKEKQPMVETLIEDLL